MTDDLLTKRQHFLLEWLSKEDWSLLGECKGPDLDRLIVLGLAEINDVHVPPGREDWRGVRLTEAGWLQLRREEASR